jgi:hypothetical protein
MHYNSLSRIVRTFVLSAALALLATASADAQMVNQWRPYNSSILNPCNNETVVFSGQIHFHEKTQIGNDGRLHFVANENFSASGVGQSTGVRYNVSGIMHTNAKLPSFPITFRQRNRAVSTSAAAPSFHITVAYHVNGGGLQTQVTNTSDCKG